MIETVDIDMARVVRNWTDEPTITFELKNGGQVTFPRGEVYYQRKMLGIAVTMPKWLAIEKGLL